LPRDSNTLNIEEHDFADDVDNFDKFKNRVV